MKTLIICNDPPYGTERSWNGLRLAGALSRRDGVEVRVFLLGDAVGCAVAGQKVPEGYYHPDQMTGAGETWLWGGLAAASGLTIAPAGRSARRSGCRSAAAAD